MCVLGKLSLFQIPDSPFLGGFSNVIGLLIIAIGLFEAWKQTRPAPFTTSGPFPLGPGIAAGVAE